MAKLPTLRNGEGNLQRPEEFFSWDPFSQITNARRTMNSLLDSVLRPEMGSASEWIGVPALDLYEKDGQYVVECAVPGLKKEDLDIEVNDNRLTISAKKQEEKTEQNAHYHYRELRRGGFSRAVVFPQDIDSEKVSAQYDNGILKISVPPAKTAQTKKVEIKG